MDNLTVFLLVVVAVVTASLAFYMEWSDHKKAKAEFAKIFAILRKLDEKTFELLQYYEYLDNKNVVTEEDMNKLSMLNRECDELKLEFDMKFKEFKSRQPKYS